MLTSCNFSKATISSQNEFDTQRKRSGNRKWWRKPYLSSDLLYCPSGKFALEIWVSSVWYTRKTKWIRSSIKCTLPSTSEKNWTDCLCVCSPWQPCVPGEGPDHTHQSPEAEAPVSGGASGALPAGAQAALHQGGGKSSLDVNMYIMLFQGHLLCKIHLFMSFIHKHVSPLCKEILKVSGKKRFAHFLSWSIYIKTCLKMSWSDFGHCVTISQQPTKVNPPPHLTTWNSS